MADTFNVSDLSWKARKRLVAETAEAFLLATGRTFQTRELVREVAARTGLPDARVAADLIKMADGVPWSRKTGETFQTREGHTAYRREWFAVPTAAQAPKTPTGHDPADWRLHAARWVAVGHGRDELDDAALEAITKMLLGPSADAEDNEWTVNPDGMED